MRGFSLIEMMIALAVLTFGLLAAGSVLFIGASSGSLARSKGTAALAAQDKLESLAFLYLRDPLAGDLAMGYHGPVQTEVVNPVDAGVLNQYRIEWVVRSVPDPRPGKSLDAVLVVVTVSPELPGGNPNRKAGWNKTVVVSTILGQEMQ